MFENVNWELPRMSCENVETRVQVLFFGHNIDCEVTCSRTNLRQNSLLHFPYKRT
jgi:hypothetical protein